MSEVNSTEVEYRIHPVYTKYRAGSDGSIWTFFKGRDNDKRSGPRWKLVKPFFASGEGSYLRVSVSKDKKKSFVCVHRLICEAFHGPCPDGMEVRHLDGDKYNNRPTNLAWATHAVNMADKKGHGTANLIPCGESHVYAKLTAGDVIDIRNQYALGGVTYASLAKPRGVTPATVGEIVRREIWKHVA